MLIKRRGEPHLTHLGTNFMANVFPFNQEVAPLKRIIPDKTYILTERI